VKHLPIYTLDFETYWDSKHYTLSKQVNFEYVTDPRFKAHGLAVREPSGDTYWVTHADLPAWVREHDLTKAAVVMQNAYFDGLIFAHHYGVVPAFVYDTKGMANLAVREAIGRTGLHYLSRFFGRGGKKDAGAALVDTDGVRDLDPETERVLAEYALVDVEETWAVFGELCRLVPEAERRLVDLHVQIYLRPRLHFDYAKADEVLARYHAGVEAKVRKAQACWPDVLGDDLETAKALLRKKDIVAKLILDEGLFPPRKRSPTTGELTYAFAKDDEGFLDLAEKSERMRILYEARTAVASSIVPSRLERFRLMADRFGGKVRFLLNANGAHTARSSGGEKLNPQNFPKNPKDFRHVFRAPDGHKVVIADSSQIEARVLAWLAGEETTLAMFREADALTRQGKNPKALGKDVYSQMASRIGSTMRDLGKVVVLGCIAEGQLVLTDHGWKPIEQVSINDKVWDGEEFVTHDGVIYQGVKEVITYDGLTATPDHIVFTEEGEMPLGEAMDREAKRWIPPSAPFSLYIDEGLIRVRRRARVYDILNAGPRHRYMVSGWVVHNCGFGMSDAKFLRHVRTQARLYGMDDLLALDDQTLLKAWAGWREANPHIVKFWYDYEATFRQAVLQRREYTFRNLRLEPWQDRHLRVWLPSGRYLLYGDVKFQAGNLVCSRGNLWYGKLTENLVQAVARDVVFYQTLTLPESLRRAIVLLVHDEINLVVPEAEAETALARTFEALSTPLPWCADLPVSGEGKIAPYLAK